MIEHRHDWVVTAVVELVDRAGFELYGRCKQCGELTVSEISYAMALRMQPLDTRHEQMKPGTT